MLLLLLLLSICCCCWRCSCPINISTPSLLLLLALLMPSRHFILISCHWRWPLHTGEPALSLSKNSHCYTSSRGSGNVGDAEIKMINECYDKCINDALEGGKSHSHPQILPCTLLSCIFPLLHSKMHFLPRDAQACGVCVSLCVCTYV